MKGGLRMVPAVWMAGLFSCAPDPGNRAEPVVESSAKDGAVKVATVPKSRPKDPSEALEHLVYLRDLSEEWLVEFGFESQGKWLPKLKKGDGVTANRVGFDQGLEPGELFFSEEPMKHRFKFIAIEDRVIHDPRLNIKMTIRYAIFEDQLANRKGTRYEVPNRLPRAERDLYRHTDGRALLSFEGKGLDFDPFTVEEGNEFALPPSSGDEVFHLKSVTPDEVVIEWKEDGKVRLKTIGRRESAYTPPKTIRDILDEGG